MHRDHARSSQIKVQAARIMNISNGVPPLHHLMQVMVALLQSDSAEITANSDRTFQMTYRRRRTTSLRNFDIDRQRPGAGFLSCGSLLAMAQG